MLVQTNSIQKKVNNNQGSDDLFSSISQNNTQSSDNLLASNTPQISETEGKADNLGENSEYKEDSDETDEEEGYEDKTGQNGENREESKNDADSSLIYHNSNTSS